jgi:outer membrane protein assembly factor BamE (lipoprotein component of BamABCDE complex)
MKTNTRILLLGLLILSAGVSCSTALKTFNKVPLGASKSYVVTELGSPHRSYRKDGVDHWVYVFPEEEGRRTEREIQFENGNVIARDGLGKPKDSDFVPID